MTCIAEQTPSYTHSYELCQEKICENTGTDKLHDDTADQRICFRYKDSTIPLLPKSESSSLLPSFVTVQPDLCQTCSEPPKIGFLMMWLIMENILDVKEN